MKICFFTHTLDTRTGAGEFAHNVIKETRELLPEASFKILTSEDALKPRFLNILKNWRLIRKSVKEADLIHALDNYPYGVIAALSNLFVGRPLIITAIGTGSLQLFEKKGWKGLLFRWAYTRADRITAISHYVARRIGEYLKGESVAVINPGIDYSFWSADESSGIEERLTGLMPYGLSVGEFKKRKGYEAMLSVFAEAVRIQPNLKYVIVANVNKNLAYKRTLEEEIKRLDLTGNVEIMSNLSREELRSVYRKAAFYFALPENVGGDVEGFGMSILQAAAAGTPAIVGRGSGADDAVRDGESGFLLSREDFSGILSEIISLLTVRGTRSKLSKSAKSFAREMEWKEKAKVYLSIYNELISR